MQPWARVAELTKARTRNGGFVARCAAGLPFLLEPGMQVSFVPPRLDVPREGRVTAVDVVDERSAAVWFDTVTSRETAEALCGSWVLVRRSDIPEDVFDDDGDFAGFAVVDERYGVIGAVESVLENPAHPLLHVVYERADGTSGEVLIPWVDAFIVDVDEHTARITTRVPTGLLDI